MKKTLVEKLICMGRRLTEEHSASDSVCLGREILLVEVKTGSEDKSMDVSVEEDTALGGDTGGFEVVDMSDPDATLLEGAFWGFISSATTGVTDPWAVAAATMVAPR